MRQPANTVPLLLFELEAHRSKDAPARYPVVYLDALKENVRDSLAIEEPMTRRHAAEMGKTVRAQKNKQKLSTVAVGRESQPFL